MVDLAFRFAYPYQPVLGQRGGLPRPVPPVRLHRGTSSTSVFLALVDSGADVSTFHVSIAQRLGIYLGARRPARVRGVGGATLSIAPDED